MFISAYSAKERFYTVPVGESRAKQSMAVECNINNIMKRYQKTGALSHVNRRGADYGFATSLDFAESMRVVVAGQELFDGLPSSIRSKFSNDPAAFLAFVQDEGNAEEMVELGLREKPSKATSEASPTPANPAVAGSEAAPAPPDTVVP